MGIIKRAYLYLIRNKGKSLICFFVLGLLGSFMAGSVALRQGIQTLEANIWHRLPPVANIHYAPGSWDDVPFDEPIPIDLMRLSWEDYQLVSALPYVKRTESLAFYLEVHGQELQRVGEPADWASHPEAFFVYGLGYPMSMIFESGTKEVVQGRYFTEDDFLNLADSAIPLLVSVDFADTNRLSLNSRIEVETSVYNPFEDLDDREPLSTKNLTFEIVGIYYHHVEDGGNELMWEGILTSFKNWAYAPVSAIETISASLMANLFEYMDNRYGDDSEWQRQREWLDTTYFLPDLMMTTYFILYGPEMLEPFTKEANQILEPRFIVNTPLSYLNQDLLNSLDAFEWYANRIILGVAISSIAILTLVILIFLKDRRSELVQYRVLGASRLTIALQLMTEISILFFFSLGFSAWAGAGISNFISRFFLRRNLLEYHDSQDWQSGAGMILLQPRTPEFYERIESIQVSLDGFTLMGILALAFLVIVLSASLANLYLFGIKEKPIKVD